MNLPSVYDSVDYESASALRRYRKRLKQINQLAPKYRAMSDDDLREAALQWSHQVFDVRNKQQVHTLFAIGREVCFRLLGKFHYDVQILGALAALERQMVQMSTGSGKTITLILPTLAFGLTRKGVCVLTVNDYLSKRDWEETRVIYDYFGLTNRYTQNSDAPQVQQEAFLCDVTYCTNATLGFAYLHSALASDIAHDVKPITRPLHAAIIDEVDEILMDDAQNPLIIASNADLSHLTTVEHLGKTYAVEEILSKLRHLRSLDYSQDEGGMPTLGEKAWEDILQLLDLDDRVFDNHAFVQAIANSIEALHHQKRYRDYIVADVPDPDSGSRIILIDKATGRLAKGRTLNDNLHAYVEMKEHVFTGSGSTSSIQITYQVLFNLFPHITGVTGTLGRSFKEFYEIYHARAVVIPDRVPNRLRSQTHLFVTQVQLMAYLIRAIRIYQSSRHPILIGAASDGQAVFLSQYLTQQGVGHRLLISTDEDEEVVVASAGQVGSVVVTTDIMGRGTDIHIQETDHERGLVVFQVGARPNSRIERQFAGRAARQGDPGRYHRLLMLPELKDMGVMDLAMKTIVQTMREHREMIQQYHGDVLMDGMAPYKDELVTLIDDALTASESSRSQSRIQNFRISQLTDLIQTAYVAQMDGYRKIVKQALVTHDMTDVIDALTKLSLSPGKHPKKEIRRIKRLWSKQEETVLLDTLFRYAEDVIHRVIPEIRAYSEVAMSTANLTQLVKLETRPEDYMNRLMATYMAEVEESLVLPLPTGH